MSALEVRAVIVRAVLLAQALLRSPGLEQRAIDGEVLVTHEPLRPLVDLGEKPLRHLAGQQPVPVLGKPPRSSTPRRPCPDRRTMNTLDIALVIARWATLAIDHV